MWTALLGLWGFLSDWLSQGHERRRLERLSADDGESGTGWERGEEDGATVEAGLVCLGREQGRRVFGCLVGKGEEGKGAEKWRLVCSPKSQALGWREEEKKSDPDGGWRLRVRVKKIGKGGGRRSLKRWVLGLGFFFVFFFMFQNCPPPLCVC